MPIRKTQEHFIQDAKNIHGDKYDYSLVVYKNNRTKVKIICRDHGVFEQRGDNHTNQRQGCRKCSDIKSREYYRTPPKTQKQFIEDAIDIHSNQYDYSFVKYVNAHIKIKIICEKHGIFMQKPGSHLEGRGCKVCGDDRKRKTQDQFIQDSIKTHNNLYDYSLVRYIANHKKVKIICKKHGAFLQRPLDHMKGDSCPKCSTLISKSEYKWLEYIGLPNDEEHRQVLLYCSNKLYRVDGFDPMTNTVYEFYGDYWHGNPDTTDHNKTNSTSKKPFRQLYEETLKKESLIIQTGYNLVTMWESDWKNVLTPS